MVWSLTVLFADYGSFDLDQILYPWVGNYAEQGFLWSMQHCTDVSNYTAFYNYFLIILGQCHPSLVVTRYAIKYFTFLWSVALGVAVALIIAHVRKQPFSWWWVIGTLLLPPVIIESGLWGQCDAIYAALCLFAFYAALKHRSKTCMVLIGLAFCMKFQFIFIVPVLLIMLIVKDADGKPYLRWRDLWLAPLMYVVNLLPVLFGAEFLPLITVYFNQADGNYLTANAATLPALTQMIIAVMEQFSHADVVTLISTPTAINTAYYHDVYVVHLLAGLGVFVWLLVTVMRRCIRQKPTAADLVHYALLFALTMPFVMPHMHDRFLFLAAVLAFIYVVCRPSRTNYWLAGLIVGSLTVMLVDWARLTDGFIPSTAVLYRLPLAVIANGVALIILLWQLRRHRPARQTAPTPKQKDGV